MKFNAEKPGVKEFAIVGGATLGVVLAWSWWSKRQAGRAAASGQQQQPAAGPAGTAPAEGTTPTGLSLGALLLWLQDHMSSATTTKTTTTRTTTGGGPPPRPRPKPKPRPGTTPVKRAA